MTLVEVFAYLVPVIAILAALLLGRYPGEDALRRRIRTRKPCRRPRRAGARARPVARGSLPRGGALLAYALAGRAPPSGPADRPDTGQKGKTSS